MGGPIIFPGGANIPPAVASNLCAGGGPTAVSLLELQLPPSGQNLSLQRLFFSDADITAVPLLAAFDGGIAATTPVHFLPWLIEAPPIKASGTLVTQTSNCSFQNLGGNTVSRDNSVLFNAQDLWGSVFVYRLWLPASEYALLTWIGNVSDAYATEDDIKLTLKSWMNFSEIQAPDCVIGPNCQNQFGSQQCGVQQSGDPCSNTYGSCQQINRFKGLVSQWDKSVYTPGANASVAQPAPPLAANQRRPG